MTTLAANKQRAYEIGDINEFPMAVDIVYEGGAVGLVDATGHAQPLTSADKFVGFARAGADNSAGSAADIRCEVYTRGRIEIPITGAVITDVGQPVYASDDDTFTFIGTGAVFVGFVWRFVSSGVAVVEFDATNFADPHAGFIAETTAVNKTLDSLDNGKVFFVTADAVVITLPAVASAVMDVRIVNAGSFGAQLMSISPAAADSLEGPDITAADNKDLQNTKATARRGDYADITHVDATGYTATALVGTWAREA